MKNPTSKKNGVNVTRIFTNYPPYSKIYKEDKSKKYIKRINMKNKYFLTIRKHQTTDYVTVDQINAVLQLLAQELPTMEINQNVYEIDRKYNQLHYHCILNITEYFKYNQLLTMNGFRLYWKLIYDITKLLSYMSKQSQTVYEEESNIIINKYTHKKALNYFQ